MYPGVPCVPLLWIYPLPPSQATTGLISRISINKIIKSRQVFCVWLVFQYFWDSSMLLHVWIVLSFLLLSNIPLYGHMEICFYIHLWWIFRMSIWGFLWIRPLWTFFVCKSLCGYVFSLLSHMVIVCLTIRNCKIILNHCVIL